MCLTLKMIFSHKLRRNRGAFSWNISTLNSPCRRAWHYFQLISRDIKKFLITKNRKSSHYRLSNVEDLKKFVLISISELLKLIVVLGDMSQFQWNLFLSSRAKTRCPLPQRTGSQSVGGRGRSRRRVEWDFYFTIHSSQQLNSYTPIELLLLSYDN